MALVRVVGRRAVNRNLRRALLYTTIHTMHTFCTAHRTRRAHPISNILLMMGFLRGLVVEIWGRTLTAARCRRRTLIPRPSRLLTYLLSLSFYPKSATILSPSLSITVCPWNHTTSRRPPEPSLPSTSPPCTYKCRHTRPMKCRADWLVIKCLLKPLLRSSIRFSASDCRPPHPPYAKPLRFYSEVLR